MRKFWHLTVVIIHHTINSWTWTRSTACCSTTKFPDPERRRWEGLCLFTICGFSSSFFLPFFFSFFVLFFVRLFCFFSGDPVNLYLILMGTFQFLVKILQGDFLLKPQSWYSIIFVNLWYLHHLADTCIHTVLKRLCKQGLQADYPSVVSSHRDSA